MKHNIIAAAILGLCLMVSPFLFSGRYYLLGLGDQRVARLDRWTGSVRVYDCALDPFGFERKAGDSCGGVQLIRGGNKGETMNVDENLTTEAVPATENAN